MMLEASLLRFGGRGAFLNVLYVRCFAYTVSECGTKHLLLFTPNVINLSNLLILH